MTIRDTSKKQPRIIDTSPRQPKIDPEELAKALGAERVDHPRIFLGNSPEVLAQYQQQQALKAKNEEHSIEVDQEEWEQLVALAQELSSEDQKPTPKQVGKALLRKALKDLIQGKQQLKASLQEQPAQAAE
jgi:hypothetical protein